MRHLTVCVLLIIAGGAPLAADAAWHKAADPGPGIDHDLLPPLPESYKENCPTDRYLLLGQASPRGLHSSTFQLILSAVYGIRGAHGGCVARDKGMCGGV
jgi:hypothetical protein